ncbi:hypothetical protein [Kitasatospora sp. NPDC091207]|uniref:hypothetical protein n=1 Tax=Kitasatospora sp. NPDC091207 TaxID=3364083 RepID=UPI00381668E2
MALEGAGPERAVCSVEEHGVGWLVFWNTVEHIRVAAMSHLRKQAPRLSLQETKAYIASVRDGSEPPEELARLTPKEPLQPPWPVETLAGPVQ